MGKILCSLCKEMIVKYSMDLGDTITIDAGKETKYVCDDCAKKIAMQIVDR